MLPGPRSRDAMHMANGLEFHHGVLEPCINPWNSHRKGWTFPFVERLREPLCQLRPFFAPIEKLPWRPPINTRQAGLLSDRRTLLRLRLKMAI